MIVCCEACYKNLYDAAPEVASSWANFCEAFIRCDGIFCVMEQRIPDAIAIMRLLEQQGYITTCDAPVAIKVRVEGYMYEGGDIESFCIVRDMHHNKKKAA